MKKFFNVSALIMATVTVLIAVFVNVSCEIGLGASVDTFPPSLSIEYPSGDSLVIRDTFVMKGMSDDETSIANVTVNFKPTESSSAPTDFDKTYTANFEPRGKKWDCTINNKIDGKYEIPDGEYKVTVVATDSAARTQTVTRVYKIDNTAPLVVIKRPANNDSYGRTLKITGDISDENTLGTLTFTPYRKNGDLFEVVKDESGNPVTYTQNNISGNGLEVIVARYYDARKPDESPLTEDEAKQDKFYRTMFNSLNTNDKTEIYYTVKVNDKAESYTGETTDSTGNVSEVFYIYDDIYADIYSDSSSDGIHLGLTNKQLIQILNGNDKSEDAVKAKEKLAEKKYETVPTEDDDGNLTFPKGVKFSISPNSSPSYTVGGYEYKNTGSTQTSITNDGVMNITVTRGADQHSLKADTIRLLIIPAKLDSNKKLEEDTERTPIVLIEAPDNYNAEGYSGPKTAGEWEKIRSESMKTGENITINIKTGTLVADEHYLVVVEGKDAENVDVEPEGGKQFGFLVSQNSQPPVVTIESSNSYNTKTSSYSTEIANNSDIPDAKIQIKGKVSVETKRASVSYKITVTDGSGTSNTPIKEFTGTVLAMPAVGWATSETEWTWTASSDEIAKIKALDEVASPSYTKGLYLLTVSFDATSSSGLSTANSVTRTFYLDTSAPEVTDVVVSPVVTYDEAIDGFEANKDYVNGKITIKANVNDNHTVMETLYSIKAGEKEIQAGRLTGNIIKINEINTADKAEYDKKPLVVEFTPVDKAGNKGETHTTTVYIDEYTDKPVIKITNADKTVSSAQDVSKDKNLFDLTTNNKILGSVSDDDQLDQISVKWKKADAADSTYADLYGFPKLTGKSSEAITIQFINRADNKKLSEGLYKLKIEGVDDHGTLGTAEFYVAIDDKDPALTITSKSDQFQTGTVTVTGTVQDSSNKITVTSPKNGIIGIYEVSNVSATNATVTKKLTEAGSPVTLTKGTDFTVSNSVVTINWTDSFACVTGGETLSYTAEDKYGKTTNASYSYKEDQVAPSITVTSPTAAVFLGSSLTSFQKFTGTASDANSGVSSIEYKYGKPSSDTIQIVSNKWTVVDGTKAESWLNSGWQTANGTTDWNLNLDCSSGYADGAYVWFRAVDVAGNKTALADIKSVSVTIDNDVPEISFIKVTSDGAEVSAVSNVYYVKKADLVITGKVKETYVPMEGGVQKCLSTDNTDGTLTATTNSSGLDFTYSIGSAKLTKGQKSIRFTAKDKATQTSSEAISVFVDAEVPNVDINAITPQVTANEKENNVNGIITVSGTASDDDKISNTILYINGTAATDATGAVLSAFSGKVTKVSYSDSGTRFSYTIDTTKWLDKSALTVKFKATDRSGNESVAAIYNAASEASYNQKELFIDQSTDVPTLSSTNMNLALTSATGISSADNGNLYGMGSQTVYITANDDDGVKSVTYKIDSGTEKTLYSGKSTSVTKNITFPDDLTGEHTITFVVTDFNGKKYTPDSIYFAIDNDVPVITGIKVGGKTYEKDMFVPKTFAITGSASDDSGISAVELTGVPAGTTVSGTTSWTSSEITETEGTKTVKVVAKDKYGRSSPTTLTFKVDITAPVWKETAAGADVPTTVAGGQKSKTHTELAAMTSPFWYNSDSVTLSGKAYDANGIAGYTLSVNGGDSLTANGSGSYSIIASYAQGANNAVLTVKDTAGNTASRTIAINVDTVDPVLNTATIKVNGAASAGSTFIKAGSTVTVDVAATDATSGVAKILIGKTPSFAESNAIATLDLSSTAADYGKKTGNIDISENVATWPDGSNTIYIRAVDVSGLSSNETIISDLVIDKTAPVVSYTSHSENETVNKTISIGGTYVEINKAADPKAKLYYRKNGTTSWTAASNTVTVNADGTWSVANFNTAASGIQDDSKYDFQIRMEDSAGNAVDENGAFITLHINQNSDRPVIKLNFTTDGNARLNSGTFAGTITDDDGDVKKLYIQAVKTSSSYSDSNWTELTVTSGSWEIPEAKKLADDSYQLYFKIVDAKNTTFVTSSTDGLTVPYIQYSTNDPVYAPVSFSVDTTAPKISLVTVALASTTSADESYKEGGVQNNDVMGGVVSKYAKFKIVAADSVSKGSDLAVNVNLAGSDYSATYDSSDKNYYTEKIDLSGIESGIYQINVTASDQANMTDNFTKMVIIDNSAPETIKNVTPANTTEVTGDFNMTGLVQDDEKANSGIGDGESMWYYIPKYSERNATGTALAGLNWKADERFSRSSVSWSLKLGDLADLIGYNSSTETVSADFSSFVVTGNASLYDIPVWFKIVDKAGNIGYNKENFIHFNPNADKPTLAITYPGESEKEDGKIIMGGNARFQGYASDNEGIEGVYLQFDMDGNGTWENGEGVAGVLKNTSGKVYAGGDKENIAVEIPIISKTGAKVYGFKAKGTLTWTSSIDVSGISGEGKKFKVRAIAIDSDTDGGQLASAWTNVIEITINNEIPQFEQMYLVQYEDSGYTSFKQQVKYEEDMFISGSNWRLEGKASHKDGIASVTVDASNTITVDASDKGIFKIPVNPSNKTSGAWTATITATDSGTQPHPKSQPVSVNIDNQAPEFADGTGELVLYKDAYGNAANKLGASVNIQNSNGQYASLASKAVENGSGFARAVIYFERDGTSEKRVYNVMKSAGADRSANKSVLNTTKADGKVYINSESLPALYVATVGRASTTTIELTTNDNIRVGGLVKIGGAYHKIAGVTASVVTLADEVSTEFTSAEFVYAMVVDNSGESRKSDGSLKDDDGDGMVESYSKSGSNYTWDIEIPSANIPDGPIQAHVVLFDKAGNFKHSYVTTRLSNNAPRITTVKLGTDLNGDGSYSEDEYEKFYVLSNKTNASGTEIWNLDTKKEMGTAENWTAMKGLSVIPEFVGGTAPFKYAFTTSGASAANLTEPVKTTATNKKNGTLTVASTDSTTGAVTASAINITNAEIGTTGEGKNVTYQFSFWDSTEETTSGVDSSWTILNATVHQLLSDSNAPKGYIRPFFWNGKDDNSLYQNSKDNGHIELEADWKTATGYDSTKTSGQYDADPKVSGKIVLRGLIYDDVRLDSLGVTFADFGTVTISSFVDGAWSSYSDTTGGKIPYATVVTQSIGQNGHVANYEIVVDTSKISGVAGADKTITLTVKDSNGNTFTSAKANGITSDAVTATYYANASQVREGKFYTTLDNAKNNVSPITTVSTPDMELNKISEAEEGSGYYKYEKHSRTGYYKVDVVPYIAKISTTLDGAYNSNASVFNRSAKGWYPVRQSESVTATGFNLKSGTAVPTVKVNNTSSTPSASSVSSITFPIGASGTSGKLEVTVNSVASLNNVNSNACEYNQEANGINNDTLDDDRQFKVWKITGVVTNDTTVRYPTFAVGKDTNQTVGFVYDSGAQSTFMNQNGANFRIDYSFTQWYDTACAVDNAGRMYGSSMNGDSGGNGGQKNGGYANYGFYAWNTNANPGYVASDASGNTFDNPKNSPGSYMAYNRGRKKVALENSYNGSSFSANRVINPKIVASSTKDTTSSTGYVYTVYYESLSDQIRFRYGTVSGTINQNNNDLTFSGGLGNHNNTNNGSATGYQIIAGTGCSGNNTIDGSSATNAARSGEYSAVGVSNTTAGGHTAGTAVVAWYDASNQRLLYSYNTAPTNTSNAAQWGQHTKVIDSDFAGWYVDMTVDPDGGVHIAYYGASNGDLKYAYMPYYDSDATVVYVDSYLSVGTNISVDYESKTVTKPDGTTMTKYVPFISYYMSSFTKTKYSNKIAWITNVDASGLPLSGVELDASGNSLDKFTGNWETMIVPTTSIPLDYSVGVGIKKNSSNVNEPILGYGVKTGLETASLQ